MRTLIVTRGNSGSGKSTLLSGTGLMQFTICPDNIRLLKSAPVLGEGGKFGIDQMQNKEVWKLTFELVEERMKKGDLIVVDATHSRDGDINQYKQLAELYRYRVYVLDFGDVDVATIKRQNKMRPEYKQVPEYVIEKIDKQLKSSRVPSWATIIKPDKIGEFFKYEPQDFSHYKKVHHFGDLHGSYDVLMDYLNDNGGMKADELYIFVGDYIDRGVQNAKVVKWLLSVMNLPNVILLEGNHEIHLWRWARDLPSFSKEFVKHTQPELEKEGVSKSEARQLYRKLRQVCYYTFSDKLVLVTHGGLSTLPDNLLTVSTQQLIKGVGNYGTNIDAIFTENTPFGNLPYSLVANYGITNVYQIHGHRNKLDLPVMASERSYNLEGKIEFGGQLRVVTLDTDGFKPHEYNNKVFDKERFDESKTIGEGVLFPENVSFLNRLREWTKSEGGKGLIKESAYGNISSFNFGKNVFWDKLWNEMTTRARGLFFNTETAEIVARSYDKFFNIGEREDTSVEYLENKMAFPVDVYLKENGFLGILGYDTQTDSLVICSKSTPAIEGVENPFPFYFKTLLMKTVGDKIGLLKNYLRDNNCTITFEVVDTENDPHIIAYPNNTLVMLDIVKRTAKYEKADYNEVLNVAIRFGFMPKQLVTTLHDKEQFKAFLKRQEEMSPQIEGFVLEDADGFMVKWKSPYYSFWKWMRTVKDKIVQHREKNPDMYYGLVLRVDTSEEDRQKAIKFFDWCLTKSSEFLKNTDIISLRELYEKDEI